MGIRPESIFGSLNINGDGTGARRLLLQASAEVGPHAREVLHIRGLWAGIRLESFSVRFTGPSFADVEKPDLGVVVQYELSPDFQAASVSVAYNLSSLQGAPVHLVSLEVTQNGERADKMAHSATFDAPSTFQVELHKPKLWYPHRYGDQPLYVFTLCLWDTEGRLLHTYPQSLGLRNVELVQEPVTGESGTSFFFRVNGIPIWCGGSNWIPAHSFETALRPDDYVAWVRLMKEGNQDMVRVWGGGVYETDAFYDACVSCLPCVLTHLKSR
jgi:beta-mannosidase